MSFFNIIKYFTVFILSFLETTLYAQDASPHDLRFNNLAYSWDKAIPLGNGILGALVWQKDSVLRLSLDRADLWDLRKAEEFNLPLFNFGWVVQQVQKGSYDTVQKLFDLPYERDPAPTRLPAGALEFDLNHAGKIESVRLFLSEAICQVKWDNGMKLSVFVDANAPVGWFRFENVTDETGIRLDPPEFNGWVGKSRSSPAGQDLQNLGYSQGKLFTEPASIYFRQEGWKGFSYEIAVMWNRPARGILEGAWSITSKGTPYSGMKSAWTLVSDAMTTGYDEANTAHSKWWKNYWSRSCVSIPDTLLENQWYREIYKFGSVSRTGAPPISLQAVWTADNGRLPPWKGDYHNDLNTEMSYWPGYASNHPEESSVFTDWIWSILDAAGNYSKTYFDNTGLNFPGVCTLTGEPMGGWIQYACSPTVAAWLAHHFYLQWRYSMDSVFLADRAYPFLFRTALFLNRISVTEGKFRKLPLSSSPEINDNSINAWFNQTTNFDLSLIRNLYKMASEMAVFLGKENDLKFFQGQLRQWPGLALDGYRGLLVAPGYPLKESHRHFSHLMAIYPLGLIDIRNGNPDRETIENSLRTLELTGTGNWCGYSWAWLGNLEARAGNGEKAAGALRTFAACFCFPNSFHVNGDQSGTGKSNFTYDPFTLEGNFAFASGIQEMLLQSQGGIIRVFPAIPASWSDVSFVDLRAEGAFLVSGEIKEGKINRIQVRAEKGGVLSLVNPFGKGRIRIEGASRVKFRKSDVLEIQTEPGRTITFTPIPKRF